MIREGLTIQVPRMYTTVKSESQQKEILIEFLKARGKKSCPLPKEYGPVNWYAALLDQHYVPILYACRWPTLRKYVAES